MATAGIMLVSRFRSEVNAAASAHRLNYPRCDHFGRRPVCETCTTRAWLLILFLSSLAFKASPTPRVLETGTNLSMLPADVLGRQLRPALFRFFPNVG